MSVGEQDTCFGNRQARHIRNGGHNAIQSNDRAACCFRPGTNGLTQNGVVIVCQRIADFDSKTTRLQQLT